MPEPAASTGAAAKAPRALGPAGWVWVLGCTLACASVDVPGAGVCDAPGGAATSAVMVPPLQVLGDVAAGFERLGPPMHGGWRTHVHEQSQSFAAYVHSGANPITAQRQTLYLQPLGDYPQRTVLEGDLPSSTLVESGFVSRVYGPDPNELADFVAAFYGLATKVAPVASLNDLVPAPTRVHKRHAQFNAIEILRALRESLPADAYSLTALVARDLFVHDEQEYAFGYGLHQQRLAIASFVQLDPQFSGRPRADDFQRRIRERAYKLVAHEIGHTLGFEHCDTYRCVMNGVAHLDELDATPLALCPLCLNKLAWRRGVQLDQERERRYGQLAAYYKRHQLPLPMHFVAGRGAALERNAGLSWQQ